MVLLGQTEETHSTQGRGGGGGRGGEGRGEERRGGEGCVDNTY